MFRVTLTIVFGSSQVLASWNALSSTVDNRRVAVSDCVACGRSIQDSDWLLFNRKLLVRSTAYSAHITTNHWCTVLSLFYNHPNNWSNQDVLHDCTALTYRVAQKSKLLILAVNEINASQTRVSFAKFIPKLVENMFDMCSIVPNYSFSILKFFKILSSLRILPIITIWNIILN